MFNKYNNTLRYKPVKDLSSKTQVIHKRCSIHILRFKFVIYYAHSETKHFL